MEYRKQKTEYRKLGTHTNKKPETNNNLLR